MRTTSAAVLFLAGLCLGSGSAVAGDRPQEEQVGPPELQTSAAPAPEAASLAEPSRLRQASVDAAWIGGAAALDLGLSRYGLAHCHACYEGHPLMRSDSLAVAMKLAGTAVGVAWADHLRQKGDRRGAKIVRWGLVGLQVALAGNALVQARR